MEELNGLTIYSQKPTREFSIKNSGAFVSHCDESVNVHDDEIVTYDISHEDLHPNPRPPMITEHKFEGFEIRPQTEPGFNRYNTGELFTFEEDDSYMKLTFQERLIHSRWQIRKKLYMDIADSLRTGKFFVKIETELNVFEYFEPFLKDMAWDSNLTSQLEGLTCILVYMKLVPSIKNSFFFLADELIQKCALTKQKSGELVSNIIFELIKRDSEGVLLHYIIKRFSAKNPKESCFAINCIKLSLGVMPASENVAKNLINGLNKTLTHSINEVRCASISLACEIFVCISDDIDTFVKNLDLKAMQVKEFKDLIGNKEKIQGKWTFFNKESKKSENNDLLILEENSENFIVDLNSLIPEGFFDIPYSTEIKVNREKLLKLTHSLETPGLVLEKKEYPTIINTLLHLVESNNNLIYTEAMKILEILIPKISRSFTFKHKHYIQFLSDKFKEKKKSLVSSIFCILHLFRVHEVCSLESLTEILLENTSHKVPHVRELSLNWILQEIQQLPNTVDLLEMYANTNLYEKMIESLVLAFGNKVLNVALKDTVGTVRDAASRLLWGFKSILPTCMPLETLVSRLPKGKTGGNEVKKEEDIEIIKEPSSPLPEFSALVNGINDKDQFTLTMVVEDIKRYAEGVFKYDLILTNLKKMEKDSISISKSLIIETLSSTFSKFNPTKLSNKLETAVLELNLFSESFIREVGHIEDHLIPRFLKLILQFPGYINKNSHKLIESTLECFFMLSNQLEIISNTLNFISETRLKKFKSQNEEKSTICLKFSAAWILKKIDKPLVKLHIQQFSGFIDQVLDIREQESLFSEQFIRELQSIKINISNHIRKCISGDVSPLRSRSPNLSISEPYEPQVKAFDVLKEVREIHLSLKGPNSSQKLLALNRFMDLIEQILAEHQTKLQKKSWKRGVGREITEHSAVLKQNLLLMSLEELEVFVKDVIFLCTKYKNTQQPTLFEELQQNTITALTSLRLILTDLEAETVFRQLLYHLPVKNSSSSFAKSFNLLVYKLFSDWLSHLNTIDVIALIGECFKYDLQFNVHIVYIHTLQWFLEIELKLGNFVLRDLSPVCSELALGLFGGPLNAAHPLSHNTKQLLIFHSQIFIEYLIEVFTLDNVCQYFEEKLVNNGKVFELFKEWAEKFKENLEGSPQTLSIHEVSPQSKPEEKDSKQNSALKAKLEEVEEQHLETQKNLEEVNKEYLNQVTINYELMQKLEKIEKPKKVEFKRTPSFKPYTDLEDLLKPREETRTFNTPAISVFETEKLDEPIIPFYMREEEIPKFQLSLLHPTNDITQNLLQVYKTLNPSHKKPFLQFISKSLSNPEIFSSITKPVLKSLLNAFIQFCVIEKLASTENTGFLIKTLASSNDLELTHELQKLLALAMEYYDTTSVICNLFELIQELLPESFYFPLGVEKKHGLKLMLKFCGRLVGHVKGLRVFQCLFSLNQLFVMHPPENLNSDCCDVQEYEQMFKVLRGISDGLVAMGPEKAMVLLKFVSVGKETKSVYLKYLGAVLAKKYNLSN